MGPLYRVTIVLMLLMACVSLANVHAGHQGDEGHHRRDTSLHQGRGGRDREQGGEEDAPRSWMREERRRQKEERRQDREERRRQRLDNRRNSTRHDDYDEESTGIDTNTQHHNRPRTRNEMSQITPGLGSGPVASSSSQGSPQIGAQQTQEVINMEWMRANLSSLWMVVRDLSRQHARFMGHRGHVGRGRGPVGPVIGEGHPSCPVGDDACRMQGSEVCGGHGECSCGHCICHPGYYGAYCQCSDHTCPLYDGMKCGGPSRGQCRCGSCVCRPGFSGEACDCPTATNSCLGPTNGTICSGQGVCTCGRCRCNDGYKGMYCEDTVYAAGVCEKLKPCVLCKAWNRELFACGDCQITITMVDTLEPAKNTCVMVNSGCILKYSYIPQGPDAYTVLVPRDMQCPPKTEEE